MGKALPLSQKFQPDSLGARAPQSFRSGIVAPERGLLAPQGYPQVANEVSHHPLRGGDAAAQEDAFWHNAYVRESYYVAGRSYDQYRPAYALGWQAAFDFSSPRFEAVEQELERRWEAHDTSSLLDWAQVRGAVLAAWTRGRACLQRGAPALDQARLDALLRPLRRAHQQAAQDLLLMLRTAEPPPTEFVRQVVDRHIGLLQELGAELPEDLSAGSDWTGPFVRIGMTLHSGWMQVRTFLWEVDTHRVLQLCDERELALLEMYRRLLQAPLSPELSSLLQRQEHRLQMHHARLEWVKLHWMQRG